MHYLDVDTTKRISKIGLGTWQFGSSEWGYGERYADEEAPAIVRRALELGVTLFDTAEIYGSGRSERILGQALGEQRAEVFIATKMFPVVPSARSVERQAKASAGRLGVEHLDLYQVHWPNPMVADATIMRGMRSLQREGLVGEVGVSNYSFERWGTAESVLRGRLLANQVGYSLVDRTVERDLLPFAESNGHVIIAYSPLAGGLLSGRYAATSGPTNQVRAADSRFRPDYLGGMQDLIAVVRAVAEAHSATPAQVALAWVIRSRSVVAIPGASSVEQLESNVAAADIQLADDECGALDAASARFTRTNAPETSLRQTLSRLKHSAKGASLLAKTWRFDRNINRGRTSYGRDVG